MLKTVLNRCKEVIKIILKNTDDIWPELDKWRNILPVWFIEQFSPEITKKEAEKRIQIPLRQRMKTDDEWTLSGWLYWLQPENRQWYWWDAVIENDRLIKVGVDALDWPLLSGSLKWLLKTAGAVGVKELPKKR